MTTNIKQQLLDSLGKIYELSKASKLDDDLFQLLDKELTFLSEYLNTSNQQSFIISIVFVLNYKGDTVDLKKLIDHLGCNPIQILSFADDIKILTDSGLLVKHKSAHHVRVARANDQLTVNEIVTDAILNNQPMPEIKKSDSNDVFQLLESIYKLVELRNDEEISTSMLFSKTQEYISTNKQFQLIKWIDKLQLNTEDAYLFLYTIWVSITSGSYVEIEPVHEGIYDNASMRVSRLQKLLSGNHSLIAKELVTIEETRFYNDAAISLSDKSISSLKECGINLRVKNLKKDNVISPSKIDSKELIFSDKEMQQLFMLKKVLNEGKFREMQQRLANKKLPIGITALLHGEPGTGKTEVAKQIAKETNRDLIKVEISKSKSMWYGESEKIVKRIFTDYKAYAKECDRMPILLFNEADAIISKRVDIGKSNTDQTENAIQNVILEELENFEGILLATTNLANNFDTAFDRRFLFKIQFQKPDVEIRAKIWNAKLPNLTQKHCLDLAYRYNFSGGQIDNILRKSEMHEVVYGQQTSFGVLEEFCSKEILSTNRNEVGFK